ncbi:ABC transporter permease [Aureispira anguillae]|uniref:ABC transporter permease n=1 Tax=Aureispira anguillae TaxID=2864201 RepID=A0A915YLY3_9BACT|nr:ABC transporter permease [Aureispira anguillae]BDS15525.1 ABC transporter permease [Aureispira anguillae]
MFDRDIWQEIFGTIRQNKLRTGLTAAGVFWGIFMLIFMLGMGDGLEKGILNEFGGRSTNSLYIWPEETSIAYKGMPVGRWESFNVSDIRALREQLPFLDILAPRHVTNNVVASYKTQSNNFGLRGEWEGIFQVESLIPTQGRVLNYKDEEEVRKVAVIGRTVQEEVFGNENPIGKYLIVKGIPFQVVGVIKFDGESRRLQEAEETIFIPLSTSLRLFGNGEDISWFVCTIDGNTRVSDVEDDIIQVLKSRHRISPEDQQAIGCFNLEKEYRKITGLFSGIRWFLWIVGIGTLMAGVVSVSNVMLITVKDRTREIGVRKAIGATPWSIISLILLESVFITTLSGYLGLLLGTGIISFIDYFVSGMDMSGQMFMNPEVNLGVSIGSLVVLVFSGLLAGLLPALHAARINPVEALRSD